MTIKDALVGAALITLPLSAWGTTLEERVEALERRDAELYHNLQERKTAGVGALISDKISLSGLLEVEASFENLHIEGSADDENASDLVLATAQLGFEAEINEQLGATLVLLYEEEDDAVIEVDEATIDYNRDAWSFRIGRQYVPFGSFPTHMISGPLTELGETQETAILIGFEQELFSVSAWVANGDSEYYDGVGHLNDWGASITVAPMEVVEVGVSFTSDFADTDAELVTNYQDRIAGWSVYAVVGAGPVEIVAEALGAVSAFDENDLDEDGDGDGDQPLTWNLEVATQVMEAVELAARIEGSDELAGEPELQYGVSVHWSPWEDVSTSLEYLRGEYDKDFGAGVDSRNLVTAKMAVEF